MGSAPGDSTKMRGVMLLESWKAPARLKGGGSIKALPRCSATKPWIAGDTCRAWLCYLLVVKHPTVVEQFGVHRLHPDMPRLSWVA